MAGRDVSISNYPVNDKNVDAYGGYALIVARDLNLTNGSVMNCDTYVGRTSTLTQSGTLATPVQGGAAPVNMGALAASLTQTSQALAKTATTGIAKELWGGVYISGSNSAVEVIDIDANWLNSSTYYNLSNVAAGATLIVNFSGDSATLKGGYGAFDGYNVLFNFVDATTLNIATGLTANVLAPKASVTGGSGVINGNVVVGDWNSSVQINANHYFVATEIPGLVSAVPEADGYAMLLAGLGLVGPLNAVNTVWPKTVHAAWSDRKIETLLGFEVQWNGYAKLSITVPLHLKPLVPSPPTTAALRRPKERLKAFVKISRNSVFNVIKSPK